MFGREDALRLDGEIKSFQRFDTATWGQLQRPPKHHVRPAANTIQVLPSNRLSTPFSVPSCITDPPHQLPRQPGKSSYSAVGSSLDGLPPMLLTVTVLTSWTVLWSMIRAECDVASISRLPSTNNLVSKKVATLARSSERGRALAAARNAPPIPLTRQIVQETKGLYPADPNPAVAAQRAVSHIFLSQIAELIPITLKRMPRLSERGTPRHASGTLIRLR